MSPTQTPPPLSVVLVDDLDDLRTLLRTALERSGYFSVVGEAADGKQGVELVGATHPDLVLLDVAMPVMDGLHALALIGERYPDVSVVMLSGFGDTSEVAQRAMALGAIGYIQKDGRLLAIPEQLRVMAGSAASARKARRPQVSPDASTAQV